MNYTIRTAGPADEEKIRELFIEMLRTITHRDDVEGYEAGYLDRFWSGGEDRIYVADEDGLKAFLSVEVHHEEIGDYIYYDDFSVTESCRNRGIGSALIREAEAYAEEIRIPAICLHVEKSNKAAMRFYERNGYTQYRDDGDRLLMVKGSL